MVHSFVGLKATHHGWPEARIMSRIIANLRAKGGNLTLGIFVVFSPLSSSIFLASARWCWQYSKNPTSGFLPLSPELFLAVGGSDFSWCSSSAFLFLRGTSMLQGAPSRHASSPSPRWTTAFAGDRSRVGHCCRENQPPSTARFSSRLRLPSCEKSLHQSLPALRFPLHCLARART
jgi:hypothetical protein